MLSSNKMKFYVFTCIILIMSIIFVTGCSSKNVSISTATPVGASIVPSSKPNEPTVEITMSTPPFEKSFPAGFQDDPVMKEIEKRLNIKINITPGNAVGDVNAKFAGQLASGDLPDITWVPSSDLLPKVISAKAAYPMDQLLDKYGKDIVTNTSYRIDYSRKYLSKDVSGNSDNKMYFLDLRGDLDDDPLQVQVAPYLRYDLWKKLGFPKLDTMDDYLPVLKKMMELEPKNDKGEKNYGVSAWFADSAGWAQWSVDVPFSMFEGISTGVDNNGPYDLDMVTFKVKPRLTEPTSPFWKAVDWFHKANQMGILDPDSFTMKFGDYLNKTAANRIFLGWAPWNIDGGNQTFTKNGQLDKGYYQMPSPNNLDQYMVAFDQPQGAWNFFISKNSKHPEKAMELLNFLISNEGTELLINGVKGVHWDEVDGKPKVKQEVVDGLKNDPDYRIKSGVYKYHNIAGRGNGVIDPKYNVPVDFMYLPEIVQGRVSALQKEGDDHFKVQFPGDLYHKTKKQIAVDTSVVAALPTLPEDLKSAYTKITSYIQTNEIKLITLKDDTQYNSEKEKFMKDVQQLGSDKLVAWYATEIGKIIENRKK